MGTDGNRELKKGIYTPQAPALFPNLKRGRVPNGPGAKWGQLQKTWPGPNWGWVRNEALGLTWDRFQNGPPSSQISAVQRWAGIKVGLGPKS